jgi:hypothetical protein
MGTVLYTPALVEQADELRDEAIIKDIIMEEANSNMAGDDVKKICIKIKGALAKESCYAQLEGTEKTDYTESQLAGYWKAVGRGYTKPITEFVKKKETIKKLLGFGSYVAGTLTGLATSASNQGTDYSETSQDKTLGTGAKIGITVGILAVLGTIVYLIRKK